MTDEKIIGLLSDMKKSLDDSPLFYRSPTDNDRIEALNYAMFCIEHYGSDKYRWHDLRKSPEDLPECNSTIVLAAMKEAYTGKIFYETFAVWFVKDFLCARENNTQLIAWRLLEPFEVSE